MSCTRLAENTVRKKLPSRHRRTTLSGHIFATNSCIDNQKKILLNTNTSSTCPHNGELRPTNGWDLLASLGHHCKFQQISRLGSVTAWQSCSGRQANFAALNRRHHLYSAGRPSRWALAHILVVTVFCSVSTEFLGLMKKVAKSPLVMDVLNIPNVQRQLERLADLLSKIQKALGEYLERERSSFPRYSVIL